MVSEKSNRQPGRRPKLYLIDRTKGKVKVLKDDDDENTPQGPKDVADKPPLSCCYVPPPVYYCAPLVAQNVICETYGRIGCCGARRRLLTNGISLVLRIMACLAISLQFDLLSSFAFSVGSVRVPGGANGGPSPLVAQGFDVSRFWIGLQNLCAALRD